jgi:molybdopterin synthase catalytic subunit
MIKVQKENFSIEEEIKKINNSFESIGAISSFIGTVRNKKIDEHLISMTLEHYPGMSEKMLKKIEDLALKKWDLFGTSIIHRYGELFPGDQIVLVITASKHRKEAVESCHFIIDWLKTKGPFWKYEKTNRSGSWVEAKQSDIDEELKWNS